MQGRFYVGKGGTCPNIPSDSKASWKNVGLYGVRILSVTENRQNVLGDVGADGAMPPPRIFGLEPPLSL